MGIAGAFLVASIGLRGLNVLGTNNASFAPGNGETVTWSLSPEGVVAAFNGASAHRVSVAPEGGETQTYRLEAGQPFELTLSNPNVAARRFKVAVGDKDLATVAVPGRKPSARRSGSGTVTELASALAAAYRVPVVVKDLALSTPVRWTFESADARTAAEQSLDGQGSATMLMNGNVLQIGQ